MDGAVLALRVDGVGTAHAPRPQQDFTDAERLVRRLIAKQLILSFVPSEE